MPKQSLSHWVRLADKSTLQGGEEHAVNAERMGLARLRAELARMKTERDIAQKATACFARESL